MEIDWGITILSIILTAAIYLLIPIAVASIVFKFTDKRPIKTIVIVPAALFFIGFSVFHVVANTGDRANLPAACLWAYIAYRIIKKKYGKPKVATSDKPNI